VVVTPYRRRPERPRVGYLTPEGVPLGEGGERLRWGEWDPRQRLWVSFDVVRSLVLAGRGEALCWNGEEIRWREQAGEPGWQPRPSDACVLRLPLEDLEPEQVVRALARWRDWLWSHGAIASGTVGSCSWSLLRATLSRPLFTPGPKQLAPPIPYTLGGRQETGPRGLGRFEGRLELVDLQAAYARTLGTLLYGGRWLDSAQIGSRDPERLGRAGRPIFVRAQVRIPEGLEYGPLPDRPRTTQNPWLLLGIGPEYPTGTTIQRVWTWQELQAAEAAGCRILRVRELWVHYAGGEPFAAWLDAVEQGRGLRGLAGMLAKMTGNALWGRFAMRAAQGQRTIRSRHGRVTVSRPAQRNDRALAAHDLAETVSGRVRARLFELMHRLGDRCLSVHTDGGWIVAGDDEPLAGGWRVKAHADRLDLLGPQTLRYRELNGKLRTVVAGTPTLYAPDVFAELWAGTEFGS
jgi:hypothetical protein